MFSQISKRIWFLWALCLIFNIITLLLVYYKVQPGGKIIALHYGVIEGVDWYGPGKFLYQIPIGAFGITLLNFALYKMLKKTGTFYAPLAPGISLLIQAVLLFAAILIAKAS